MKTKKAVSYFTLIAPFVLILFAFLLISFVNPMNNFSKKIDFGNTLKQTDYLIAKMPAQNFYNKENLKTIVEISKTNFIKQILEKDISQRIETKNADPLITCKINDLQLWYNQKNEIENQKLLESNQIANNIDTKKEDTQTQTNTQNQKTQYSNCMPNFKENFEKDFENYLKTDIQNQITGGLSPQNYKSASIVNVEYDQKNNKIQVEVIISDSKISRVGVSSIDDSYKNEYELGQYPTLIKTLNEIIPQVPQNFKDEIPKCLNIKENDEMKCYNQIFENLINTKNPNLLKQYEVIITKIENFENDEYIGLKTTITNKANKNKEVEYGILLKNDIPYTLINFNLINDVTLDNVVNVEIEKPAFNSKITNYVILYSYDNFFNEQSKGYTTLINFLKQSKIPANFENTGIRGFNTGTQYYRPKDGFDSNVNLLLVENNNDYVEQKIEGDTTKKEIKKIKIHQIYNPQTKKYELINNQPIYLFVFATDKNYNYYVEDDIEQKIKSITPNSIIGPNPLAIENKVLIEGKVLLSDTLKYEKTFFVSIENYQDPNFDHYDLYIVEKGGAIKEKCIDAKLCQYIDGSSIPELKKASPIKMLVTSDPTSQKGDFDVLIYNPNIKIENNKEYTIYVIPVDSNSKGTMQTKAIPKIIQSTDLTHYIITNENQKYEPFSKTIKIIDSKPPKPTQDIHVEEKLLLKDNFLYLQWQPLNGEDITKLQVKIEKFDSSGSLISSERTTGASPLQHIDINGQIPGSNQADYTTIKITDILPIDSSNNIEKIGTPTFSASYTK